MLSGIPNVRLFNIAWMWFCHSIPLHHPSGYKEGTWLVDGFRLLVDQLLLFQLRRSFSSPLFGCCLNNGLLLLSSSFALARSISKRDCIRIHKCWWCGVCVFGVFLYLLVLVSLLMRAICWEVFHLGVRLMLYCGVSSAFCHWNLLCPSYIDFRPVKSSCGGGLSIIPMEMLL